MFTTLKNGPNQAPLVAIQESNRLPTHGQGHHNQACIHCHEKKVRSRCALSAIAFSSWLIGIGQQLKCTALKDGCDRCFSEGLVCKLPNKRRDSKTQQKAGVAKAAARRNKPNKSMASQALAHKYTSSQTSNCSRTPETVTPVLTSYTSSASSKDVGIPTPLPSAQSDNDSNGFWKMSSLDSGNRNMALRLGASDPNVQSLKSPSRLDDFFVDPNFDAFELEQDNDIFLDSRDLDFEDKDWLEMLKVGRSPTLDDGDARSIISPFAGCEDSQVCRLPTAPPPSPWNNDHRSMNTPVPLSAPTKKAEHDPDSRHMQCSCLEVTLSLLEKVYFRDTRLSVSNWIGLLHEFKQWMRSFREVAECTACNCATDSLMLLVVVCEKLGDSFQIISTVYEKLADALRGTSSSRTPEMCTLGEKYNVDTVEEFACLFKALALRHLHFLYRTIISLDSRAIQQELTTHHEALHRQINRLRLLKGTIDQAHLKETEAGRRMIRKC